MCIIFYFSSQDSGSTNILSKNVTRKIAETIFSDYKTMNADIQNTITSQLNLFIRKTAHFSFVLSYEYDHIFCFCSMEKKILDFRNNKRIF